MNDIATLELDIATALESAKIFRVTDDATRLKASESRKQVKQWEKLVEEKHGPEKEALYKPYKAKLDEIKELTDILKKLDTIFKTAIQNYDAEVERKRQELARQEILARLEAQREAEKNNQPAPIVAPVELPPEPPKAAGEYVVEIWSFEITDFAALPDEYKIANEALIRSVVRELKGLSNIPGVKAIMTKDVRQRA